MEVWTNKELKIINLLTSEMSITIKHRNLMNNSLELLLEDKSKGIEMLKNNGFDVVEFNSGVVKVI